MALQPATRRLLTEAAAAAAYQPKGAYLTTAQRGAASGVASLGADGLVPAAQLPPSSSVVFAAAKAADLSRVVGSATPDPDLTFPNVPAGTYEFSLLLLLKSSLGGGASFVSSLNVTAGGMFGAWVVAGYGQTPSSGYATVGTTPPASLGLATLSTSTTAFSLHSEHIRGMVQLSAAATLSLNWTASGQTIMLSAGSGMRLVKVG